MRADELGDLLRSVARGQIAVEEALSRLRPSAFEELGFACVDLQRGQRTGFPEVILGQGKTEGQIVAIAERLVQAGGPLLVTRVPAEVGVVLRTRFPDGVHDPLTRTFHWLREEPADVGRGVIRVISAGTSDLPVAEEAALTARLMGNRVERIHDVGVAGLHRLLHHQAALSSAAVLVVVAGMEGALPSVVGGLTSCPVVAVPTSTGYGASFQGLAALLGMLNSCAPGVVVVNIDNGFGAGYAAARMNRRADAT